MNIEKIILNAERNVTLTAYIQETEGRFDYIEKRPGMLIIPGGGYQYCSEREADPPAMAFLKAGFQVFILQYSIGRDAGWPNPLNDYEAAMELIQSKAEEWKVYKDKIAVLGFSAGGHLASTAATHFTDAETRPDFQILFYPVVTMDPTYTHMGSHDNLLGKNPSKELEQKYSNELQVTPETPQAFIMHSSNDGAVPVANSVNYYMALVKNNVPASLHTYPIGGHGWGFRDSFIYKRQWTGELEKWLREINK